MALALALIALVGGAGYLLGTILQAPEAVQAVFRGPISDTQAAPIPVSPIHGSEFVDSDILLEWHWGAGLAENQLYVLRV